MQATRLVNAKWPRSYDVSSVLTVNVVSYKPLDVEEADSRAAKRKTVSLVMGAVAIELLDGESVEVDVDPGAKGVVQSLLDFLGISSNRCPWIPTSLK